MDDRLKGLSFFFIKDISFEERFEQGDRCANFHS